MIRYIRYYHPNTVILMQYEPMISNYNPIIKYREERLGYVLLVTKLDGQSVQKTLFDAQQ